MLLLSVECGEGPLDWFATIVHHASSGFAASIGEGDVGAAGVTGVGLPSRHVALYCLLHEAGCAGLIDANGFAEFADAERTCSAAESLEQAKPGHPAPAELSPATMTAVMIETARASTASGTAERANLLVVVVVVVVEAPVSVALRIAVLGVLRVAGEVSPVALMVRAAAAQSE